MGRNAPNPWAAKMWIPDHQRVVPPPAYFFQRLHDQDADLRLLPSRKSPGAFVLARVRRSAPGPVPKELVDTMANPDTLMCWKYGLVPVCMVYKTGASWNPDPLIRNLQARDTWAVADAIPGTASRGDKLADLLEAQEAADKEKQRQATRDDLWMRSGAAWNTYQARTGQRISLADLSKPRTERRVQSAPSGSTAGSGQVGFTNR